MLTTVLVVVVVNRVSPVGRRGFIEEWHQTASLNLIRNGDSCCFQKCGGIVDVLNQLLIPRGRLDVRWPADQKRHLERLLEHPAFVVPPVLAQIKTLIRAVDHNRVLRQPRFVEKIEQPSDVLIHRVDAPEIVFDIALILPSH